MGDTHQPRVDYFYDASLGNYHLGEGHPMRPHRVRLTHHLVVEYGLYKHLNVFRPKPASRADLTAFHSDDYMHFLNQITPDAAKEELDQMERFNLGADCPIFDGLYEYCQTYTGGSIAGAARINQQSSDIVLNWAGGMHHAKRGEASGFCYINDIVLAILELLKVHPRVLYIDIDIHHGDGVEEAFYLTNRVMTLSFHQWGGNFFPGTGHADDLGSKSGKNYSLNFPLRAGMNDAAYESIFKPVVEKVMAHFAPSVVVVCCGADSISGDRVGCWNLTIRGHGACLEYLKTFNVPLLLLGGGGYTIRNVSRCWCYETSRMLNQGIPDTIPGHEFSDYYAGNDYKLHVPISNMENENSPAELEKIKAKLLTALSSLEHAPNVQMQTGNLGTRRNPDGLFDGDSDDEDEWEPITRPHRALRCHLAEFYDEPDAQGDLLGTDRPNREFDEPPSDEEHL